jgi:hypothetical protein
MVKYICTNPECDSYLDEIEIPEECSNPVCNDCGEELQKEE